MSVQSMILVSWELHNSHHDPDLEHFYYPNMFPHVHLHLIAAGPGPEWGKESIYSPHRI